MRYPRARFGALAAALALCGLTAADGQQIVYLSGQTIAPAFEGWEQNPDGSFDMVFGYFNRNLEEHLHVPIGRTTASSRAARTGASPPGSCRAATGSTSGSGCPPTSATGSWCGR